MSLACIHTHCLPLPPAPRASPTPTAPSASWLVLAPSLPACLPAPALLSQMLPDRIPVDLAASISVELPMWAFRRIPGVADEPGALRCA